MIMNNEELQQRLETLPSNYRVQESEITKMIEESKQESQTFWGKEMVISFKLKCGFTVTGRSACVDPANFNKEIGIALCKKDAVKQLWQLEGYRKQWQWFEQGKDLVY
jgi:hypothetical protein